MLGIPKLPHRLIVQKHTKKIILAAKVKQNILSKFLLLIKDFPFLHITGNDIRSRNFIIPAAIISMKSWKELTSLIKEN